MLNLARIKLVGRILPLLPRFRRFADGAVLLLCGALLLWSLGACFVIGFRIAAPVMAAALAGCLLAWRWGFFRACLRKAYGNKAGRVLILASAALIGAGALVFAAASAMMVHAARYLPHNPGTVIVLGCQVRGEAPSLMLTRRMEAALAHLRENPESVGVLSGGQGPGEWITEAECMRRFFVTHGIAEDRLYLEDRSTSTLENIRFSMAIIEDHGLPRDVAIATDGFHQFRAQRFARQSGLRPGAVSAKTPFGVLPFYWVREVAAIIRWIPELFFAV